MNAAVINCEALTVADTEDVHSLSLPFASSVMMNITASYNHVLALVNLYGTVTAFVDIRVRNSESCAVLRLDPDGTASVEGTGINANIRTVFQFQNTTRAKTGLCRMPGGELCDSEVPATDEFDYAGISRHCSNRAFFDPATAESETVDVVNDQLRSLTVVVIDAIPGVIGAMGIRAVI